MGLGGGKAMEGDFQVASEARLEGEARSGAVVAGMVGLVATGAVEVGLETEVGWVAEKAEGG